ncbi:MAG: hypothetical protein LBD99_03920, partial [Candidatus Margulisbacteria bacterium]|nr:hypothetical protein [Candidatus Margulisiibacteriota bacterium]
MLKKIAGILLGLLLLTGCGVNIRQEGNKIYTDLSKDRVYDFATTAVQAKGYTITKEDEANYTFTAAPEDNRTLGSVEAGSKSLQASVTDGTQANETVVTILALINGDTDKESSEQIAKEAVAEIIAELNKYGKFNSQKSAEYTYAIATTERVSAYIAAYLTENDLTVQARPNAFGVREKTANNQFNEPLSAVISLVPDADTGRLTVRISAALPGNYDVNGNQAYIDNFTARLLEYLDTYPVVEKGTRHTYRYIDFDKAFASARNAVTAAGYQITETDRGNYVLSAVKDS